MKKKKIYKKIVSIYLRLRYIYVSFRNMVTIGLGDEIWYKGKKYTVLNGVSYGCWTIVVDGKRRDVPRNECRKVKDIKNYIHTFKTRHSWLMTSWYDIDLRRITGE